MKVSIIYSDPKEINSHTYPSELEISFYDEYSRKTQRQARSLKRSYAATESPCVFIYDDKGEINKIFYSEEFEDPISEFLNWYNESKSKEA